MAIRQTRAFVLPTECADWAETIIGRVIRSLVQEFSQDLRWFWFSRYISLIDVAGEDRGDCDFNAIPADYKLPFPGTDKPGHRSLRFRFEIADVRQQAFEVQLRGLLAQHGYAISGILDYDQVVDTGCHRFLGEENRRPGRDSQRATLVTSLYHTIARLVIDCLVGPDGAGRYRIEANNDPQNPNGSTFESVHHLFCNITQVPLSVLCAAAPKVRLLGTHWGPASRIAHRQGGNGQLITEVFVPY
jgi:hypothetical protein